MLSASSALIGRGVPEREEMGGRLKTEQADWYMQ